MTFLRRSLLPACLALSTLAAQTPSDDLAKRVEALEQELGRLRATPPAADGSTTLGGYGEIQFSHFTREGSRDSADLRRFVLALTHRFDERTELVTELEVEHAVSSADDAGEVEVEQAYIEHRLSRTWALRGGLFLIPAGLLNEHHEPTAYHGVERNLVETAIIPSTWREGGLQVVGRFDSGLLFQAGISTGFDFTKWDAASREGAESPLGAVHQELSAARAHDLAGFAALNWRGQPGLLLGASVFHARGGQGQPDMPAMGTTLWDVHARWTPGAWDLSSLFAQGTIRDTAAFNRIRIGNPTLVPSRFKGFLAQVAYRLPLGGTYALSPFLRFESVNTAAAFENLGQGLTPEAARAGRVWTGGLDLGIGAHVVLKADLRRFLDDPAQNRLSLGLGWAF